MTREIVRILAITEDGKPISVKIGPGGISFKVGHAKWSSSTRLDWESLFVLAGLGVKASTDPNMTK